MVGEGHFLLMSVLLTAGQVGDHPQEMAVLDRIDAPHRDRGDRRVRGFTDAAQSRQEQFRKRL
ncbi:hypothetical protein [Nocardia testacea]|uniref:hypothetical protein n=1 Tax=Nocardia testacea TaxID=248551 RepID=UPI0002E51265|nr:hypothetical protein [Nocardia testacea]